MRFWKPDLLLSSGKENTYSGGPFR